MDYIPPQFRRPNEYDVPATLDGVFEAYQRGQAQKQQDAMTGVMLRERFNGIDPRRLTPEQLDRGFAGPAPGLSSQALTPRGAGSPGEFATDPAQPQFDENPAIAALQRHIQSKRQGQALGQQKEIVDMEKTRSETIENLSNATGRGMAHGFKAEGELRGELQKLSKPFVDVRDAYSRIQHVSKNPGEAGAGDLAIIFNYMKMLDPGSTVREGEFANAQNSGGVPDRIVALHNKLVKGDRLSETQRRDFIERADELYQSQLGAQKRNEEQYRGLAGRMGARPENVILDQGLPIQPQPEPRSVPGGTVKVQLPDGRMGNIPAANLDAALKRGARRL